MAIADHKSKMDEHDRPVFDVSDSIVNSSIISDSIILWTTDDKPDGFIELINCIHRLTSFCHNQPMIFFRGGIVFGEFYYDYNGVIRGKDSMMFHSIMLGNGLVDAFEIEKKLQIAGCVISDDAVSAAAENEPEKFDKLWQVLISEKKVIRYEMPLKKGSQFFWTINWVRNVLHPEYNEVEKGFSSFNKSVDSEDVKEKIANTLSYYSYIKSEVFRT